MGVISSFIFFFVDCWKLFGCVIFLMVWKGFGYYMIVYFVVLGNVDYDFYEVVVFDGVGIF